MRKATIQLDVYRFSELSEFGKKTAIRTYAEKNPYSFHVELETIIQKIGEHFGFGIISKDYSVESDCFGHVIYDVPLDWDDEKYPTREAWKEKLLELNCVECGRDVMFSPTDGGHNYPFTGTFLDGIAIEALCEALNTGRFAHESLKFAAKVVFDAAVEDYDCFYDHKNFSAFSDANRWEYNADGSRYTLKNFEV